MSTPYREPPLEPIETPEQTRERIKRQRREAERQRLEEEAFERNRDILAQQQETRGLIEKIFGRSEVKLVTAEDIEKEEQDFAETIHDYVLNKKPAKLLTLLAERKFPNNITTSKVRMIIMRDRKIKKFIRAALSDVAQNGSHIDIIKQYGAIIKSGIFTLQDKDIFGGFKMQLSKRIISDGQKILQVPFNSLQETANACRRIWSNQHPNKGGRSSLEIFDGSRRYKMNEFATFEGLIELIKIAKKLDLIK